MYRGLHSYPPVSNNSPFPKKNSKYPYIIYAVVR